MANPVMPLLLLVALVMGGQALAHGGPSRLDTAVMLWFRAAGDSAELAGPAYMLWLWKGLTWSGDTMPRIVAGVLAMALLWVWRRREAAAFLAAVLLSGTALSTALKVWVNRPRPQLVSPFEVVTSASFPSGHALVSTLFFVTLALLVAPRMRSAATCRAVLALTLLLSLAIGASRVALGVHWPSDVLAGWALAGAWLWLWFALARRHWPAVLA